MATEALEILYEDNHLVFAVKPVGVLSQSDGSGAEDMLTLLSQDIAERYGKPGKAFVGLVHRLDRNVGGTMVFARTSKGASRASEDMRTGNFYKGYLALARTPLKAPGGDGPENGKSAAEGYLRHRLLKKEKENRVFESERGKECLLYYKYICPLKGAAGETRGHVYFVIPVTGRTHQIRAQFAFSGSPLLGDLKYGTGDGGSGSRFEIGLWSFAVSVRKTVKRDERIWAVSLPESSLWRGPGGLVPEEIREFAASGDYREILEKVKERPVKAPGGEADFIGEESSDGEV
jgi:23S rRNA pseudouridine1911/1915/1917 synthase